MYVHAGMTIPVLFPVCAKRAVPRTYGHISSFHLFPLSFSRSIVPHFPMFHLLVCPSSHFLTFRFPHAPTCAVPHFPMSPFPYCLISSSPEFPSTSVPHCPSSPGCHFHNSLFPHFPTCFSLCLQPLFRKLTKHGLWLFHLCVVFVAT